MLARIIEACIVGAVLGIIASMFNIIETDVIKYIIVAIAYLVVTIIFTIWLLKWYLLSAAIIALFIITMSKRHTGE